MGKVLAGMAAAGMIAGLTSPAEAMPSASVPMIVESSSPYYVALGDSLASGQGLRPVAVPGRNEVICGTSPEAYPTGVAAQLGMRLGNYACSGATLGDLYTKQRLPGTRLTIQPQIPAAYENGTPELITITAGANDMRWTYFVDKCAKSICGTSFDKVAAAGLRGVAKFSLNAALIDITAQSKGQPPQVIVTGYYNPVSEACRQRSATITAPEMTWLEGQRTKLNTALQETAESYAFADYVSVDFTGHDMCSKDSWVQAVGSKAPFHATARGQQEIARAVLAAVKK